MKNADNSKQKDDEIRKIKYDAIFKIFQIVLGASLMLIPIITLSVTFPIALIAFAPIALVFTLGIIARTVFVLKDYKEETEAVNKNYPQETQSKEVETFVQQEVSLTPNNSLSIVAVQAKKIGKALGNTSLDISESPGNTEFAKSIKKSLKQDEFFK